MSMNDPIADMLTRIRNAIMRKFDTVEFPDGRHKRDILEAIKREGFIESWEVFGDPPQKDIRVVLKYGPRGEPVINRIKRVSRVGCRIFKKVKEIRPVLGGLGVQILTTPKGVLSDREARRLNVGGEVIAELY